MVEGRKIERLFRKAVVLLAVSFIGIMIVVRGEIIGERDVLYALGGIIGMFSAIFAGLICFYISGFKDGLKGKINAN
ncbi:hypothetical protein KAW18_02835 [candidate division WOR-3 bacterium]|nr:hypothetical protein [candidate division WOR-3 bacterium]